MRRAPRAAVAVSVILLLSGCGGGGVESAYGRARGPSINGTGAFAALLRGRGHTVRTTVRLNDEVSGWAETIVRFAPYPGPPDEGEARWYHRWLSDLPGRRLVYVPRDFDAEAEYWDAVLRMMPPDESPSRRANAEKARTAARSWHQSLPDEAEHPAPAASWFEVQEGTTPTTCDDLAGPWAEGLDAKAAALTRHDTLKATQEHVLLTCDRKPLVLEWDWTSGAATLIVANGSFLLNEPLARRARRPLAERVAEWIGPGHRRVLFVETRHPDQVNSTSVFAPFTIDPLNWVLGHWLAFMLILCLSMAAILGRPRPEPPSGADRPVAHAEALGDLLRRAGDPVAARSLLEEYRRWRHPSPGPGRLRDPSP